MISHWLSESSISFTEVGVRLQASTMSIAALQSVKAIAATQVGFHYLQMRMGT